MRLQSLSTTNLAGDVVADVDLLVVEQHAVNSFDSIISSLGSLVMDESVALGAALIIGGDLAREHVSKGSKGIVKSLKKIR